MEQRLPNGRQQRQEEVEDDDDGENVAPAVRRFAGEEGQRSAETVVADELPARHQQGGELGQQEGHAPSRPTAQPGRAGVEEVRVARKPDP